MAFSNSSPISTLRRVVGTSSEGQPSATELTKALLDVSMIRPEKQDWSEALASGSPWRATFSASQDALQAAKHNHVSQSDACGRFLPQGFGRQTFVPSSPNAGTFSNVISPFNDVIRFCLTGSYSLKGRIMTLEFEELQVKLLSFDLPAVNIREGQGVRQWLEKLVRGGKKNTSNFEKRPNVYAWFHVDDCICVAQGSSGSVALWVSDGGKRADRKNIS